MDHITLSRLGLMTPGSGFPRRLHACIAPWLTSSIHYPAIELRCAGPDRLSSPAQPMYVVLPIFLGCLAPRSSTVDSNLRLDPPTACCAVTCFGIVSLPGSRLVRFSQCIIQDIASVLRRPPRWSEGLYVAGLRGVWVPMREVGVSVMRFVRRFLLFLFCGIYLEMRQKRRCQYKIPNSRLHAHFSGVLRTR
jgi:hypothetical protein